MSYIIRHNSNEDYLKQHKDIVKIFSCEDEIVSRIMSLYYGVDIIELTNNEVTKEAMSIHLKVIEQMQLLVVNMMIHHHQLQILHQVF